MATGGHISSTMKTWKLVRCEFLGGPLDGKWLSVAACGQDSYIIPFGGTLHRYDRDEIYEPAVRTVFRHAEILKEHK